MTDTEKLNALADDIAAGFQREPWRDQPGMGYVEIQMDKADAAEYRAMAARIAKLEAEAAAPAKDTFLASKAVPSPQEVKAAAHISTLMAGWDESANENAELRRQVAQLEAERDALAAAVIATPMPSIIENTQPFAPVPADSLLKLEWRAGRVYEWWATREGDVEFARRILAARDARMKTEGALEALRGLPGEVAAEPKLLTTNPMAYWRRRGYNEYRAEVDAAIAAPEAEQGEAPAE